MIYVASRDGGIYGWRWPIADSTECDCVNISMTDHTLPVTGIATNNGKKLEIGRAALVSV